eukprot:SAG31_NODE_4952_length_2837_cov_3.879474_3_plen_283_part_00
MATDVYRCLSKRTQVKLDVGTNTIVGSLAAGDVVEAIQSSADGESMRIDAVWTPTGPNFSLVGWVRVDDGMQRLPNRDANAWKLDVKPKLLNHVLAEFTSLSKSESTSMGVLRCTQDTASVRDAPRDSATEIGSLRTDQVVEVLEAADDWVHFKAVWVADSISDDAWIVDLCRSGWAKTFSTKGKILQALDPTEGAIVHEQNVERSVICAFTSRMRWAFCRLCKSSCMTDMLVECYRIGLARKFIGASLRLAASTRRICEDPRWCSKRRAKHDWRLQTCSAS